MKLAEAKMRAAELVAAMSPYCHRCEIAGSVRREKQDCKDLELVLIPKWEVAVTGANLFEQTTAEVNLLHGWAISKECPVIWIKNGIPEIVPALPSAFGRQWKGLLPDGQTKIDVFICFPENWGSIFLIRTGSADFSKAVVTYAKNSTEYRFAGGSLTKLGEDGEALCDIETLEETDVFDLLGLEYVIPKERHGWAQVVRSWK